MAKFEYTQAEDIRDAFAVYDVRYLFLGKSGAVLLGFPDTTQDADLYVDKSPGSCAAVAAGLRDLGFALNPPRDAEVARGKALFRGKALVQLKCGPFDLDLIFAPDGIESFEEAWDRRVVVDGFPVCHPDDIIASKVAANRAKDRESLPRLRSFLEWWRANRE